MKLLVTENCIISLENVRRVEKRMHESTHSSYGKKYTVSHYEIVIIYNDQTSERIECGGNDVGAKISAEYFIQIHNTLSEG